jgi:hypothetical protein
MVQGENKTGQKGTNAMFVMTHNAIKHVLQQNKNSLTGIQLSIIGHKKKIQTESKLRQEVTSSRMNPARLSAQQTWTRSNSAGIASSARQVHNICALTFRIFN